MKKKSIEDSKLYSLISTFSGKEVLACKRYLQSPYFNKSDELFSLFELISAAGDDIKKLSKTYLWKKLIARKTYNDVRFRKYCSDLFKLIQNFLIQQEFDTTETSRNLLLLKVVEKRKADNIYRSALRSATDSLEEYAGTVEYHKNKYEVEKMVYYIENYDMRRDQVSNLETMSLSLDKFYISEKLKLMCTALSRVNTISHTHTYEINLDQEIINYLSSSDLITDPRIQMYYYVYLSHTEEDIEDNFYNLRSSLKAYALSLGKEEANSLYTFALNYCSRKINAGRKQFLQEIFLLYQDLLEKELMLDHEKKLDPGHFKNIITVGLRLNQYQWTENFIKEYSLQLPTDQQSAALSYNLAQLYFYQNKYDSVLELLQEVDYKDIYYNLNAKSMLLATYYELDEVDALFSLIESFRAYLNRQKRVPQNRKILYQNLIKYTRKLANILPGDKKAIVALRAELDKTKKVASLNWLLEKIAELE